MPQRSPSSNKSLFQKFLGRGGCAGFGEQHRSVAELREERKRTKASKTSGIRISGANSRKEAHDYGHKAERFAAWYLRMKGYRVISMRYRNAHGEIDILATRGNTLAAVEVKARRDFAACEISVPPMKQQKIVRALGGLMASSGKIAGLARANERNIRFDVIWVVRGFWPRHIKDAWRP